MTTAVSVADDVEAETLKDNSEAVSITSKMSEGFENKICTRSRRAGKVAVTNSSGVTSKLPNKINKHKEGEEVSSVSENVKLKEEIVEEFEVVADSSNDDVETDNGEKFETPLELVEVQYNDHEDFDNVVKSLLGFDDPGDSWHLARGYSKYKKKYKKTSRVNRKGPYTCEECGKVIRFRQQFDQHMLSDHGIARPYSCPICGQQFKVHRSVERHVALHAMECSSSDEGIHSSNITDVKWQKNNDSTNIPTGSSSHCKMCAKPIILQKNNTGDKPFTQLCQMCKQKIVQSQLYQSEKFHASQLVSFKCETCSLQFKDQDCWKNHLLEHTSSEKKTKNCEICSKTFISSRLKARHILSEHINSERKDCKICKTSCKCGAGSKKVLGIQKNLNRNQSGSRKMPYTLLKSTTEQHSQGKDLHSTEPKIFHCMYCKFRHHDREKLNLHIKDKHAPNRVIQCDECSHTFVQESGLKNHKRIHTGECSYLCPICGLSFITQGNVFSHLRIHPNSTKSLVEL
ncbi:zinc finger protein 510-like [Limulus polyphemus]|uniref:Zinc finger protein 510-like n=1 Tax=Limulus polyphemus TaxID=6850 RepID=A0ABM1TL69_LIMPO|nr:zinc finger protein 510-like [Limulus polyphemus]